MQTLFFELGEGLFVYKWADAFYFAHIDCHVHGLTRFEVQCQSIKVD